MVIIKLNRMVDGGKYKLIAGHVALDFANTLDNRFDPEQLVELLESYGDFTSFAQESGIITAEDEKALHLLSGRDRQNALTAAREFREILWRVFSAIARNERVPRPDLALFNDFLKRALKHRVLTREQGLVGWGWRDLTDDADGPLWPITLAAAELLTGNDIGYVRECGAETCRWLFLDLSKNHTRRWCDMKLCGNRTKARRYYLSHAIINE